MIIQNARPAENTHKKADFIIRAVSGAEKDAHVILIEDKRASFAGQSQAWSDAPVYAIVNVGRYSRFYVLHPHAKTLQDLPATGGKVLHLKDDAKAIAKILTDLCAATLPYVSSSSGSSSSGSAKSSRHSSPSRPGSSSGAPGSAAGKALTSGSAATVKQKKKD
ncbi:hypothetical protein B0I37DRAFT_443327 [Chaetomium sp. MPI-CAGE-AT-0009]|nr:hypothetical protein B0I37DRAFT_443327 [Chaetomium sp. MPI-CAGE-AT-0009]